MVEGVQSKGGEVIIFSSMHESGQRKSRPLLHLAYDTTLCLFAELNQITGIAAILTFPLDVEIVEAEEREEAEERKRKQQELADQQ